MKEWTNLLGPSETIPLLLAMVGIAAAVGGVFAYGSRIADGENKSIGIVVAGLLAGVALSVASVAWPGTGGPRAVVLILGSLPLLTASVLVFVHAKRRVPVDGITVRVGEKIPEFRALTPEGEIFESTSFAGQRVLLKFYRGEWCPFCQAELKRFEVMRADLQRLGIQVIALSKDSPGAAARHRDRDGLRLQLLCDPDLKVIRRFGLEHRKALEISDGPRLRVFGMSVGTRPVYRHMAAPTTLLIDEFGVVRWIDQTEDYKVRSQPGRVLEAARAAFPHGSHVPISRASVRG